MKNHPYMNVNRIEFMVTYQCTGKCKHCSVIEKINLPTGYRHVQAQEATAAVERLSQLFPITSIMTFGGEPLLYSDVVCAIHEKATQCNISVRQLITNGYFTKDTVKCEQVAKALHDAGVNNLLISADAFHQETIPFDMVYRFAKYSKNAGIPKVRLHPAWVVDEANINI